jgi:hypothetical protein
MRCSAWSTPHIANVKVSDAIRALIGRQRQASGCG